MVQDGAKGESRSPAIFWKDHSRKRTPNDDRFSSMYETALRLAGVATYVMSSCAGWRPTPAFGAACCPTSGTMPPTRSVSAERCEEIENSLATEGYAIYIGARRGRENCREFSLAGGRGPSADWAGSEM